MSITVAIHASHLSAHISAVTICNVNAIRLSMIPNDIQMLTSSRRTSFLDGSDSKVSNKDLYDQIAEGTDFASVTEC